MADRVSAPVVHTLHGPFDEDARRFYARHGVKASIVAISRAQLDAAPAQMGGGRVVHNPIDCAEWPFRAEKEDFLLWIGRMSPDKGPHRAIAAAREAGAPLVLAGPVQPGQEAFFAQEVEPHLGRDGIEYVGEADAARKRDLYQRARALLMPIRRPEPFGLVMVEALACGTPVIAFPEGPAPEVVQDGLSGFVVDDEHAMARRGATGGARSRRVPPRLRGALRRPGRGRPLRGGLPRGGGGLRHGSRISASGGVNSISSITASTLTRIAIMARPAPPRG